MTVKRMSPCLDRSFSVLLSAFLLLIGCETLSSLGGSDRIDNLFLLSSPAALNLDGRPGSDGFTIQLYAYQEEISKGLPITSGELEIALYDGRVTDSADAKLRNSWKFAPDRLEPQQVQTSFGTGYFFVLRWEHDDSPDGDVTVVVRYTDESGSAISSAPITLAVEVKRSHGAEG